MSHYIIDNNGNLIILNFMPPRCHVTHLFYMDNFGLLDIELIISIRFFNGTCFFQILSFGKHIGLPNVVDESMQDKPQK